MVQVIINLIHLSFVSNPQIQFNPINPISFDSFFTFALHSIQLIHIEVGFKFSVQFNLCTLQNLLLAPFMNYCLVFHNGIHFYYFKF